MRSSEDKAVRAARVPPAQASTADDRRACAVAPPPCSEERPCLTSAPVTLVTWRDGVLRARPLQLRGGGSSNSTQRRSGSRRMDPSSPTNRAAMRSTPGRASALAASAPTTHHEVNAATLPPTLAARPTLTIFTALDDDGGSDEGARVLASSFPQAQAAHIAEMGSDNGPLGPSVTVEGGAPNLPSRASFSSRSACDLLGTQVASDIQLSGSLRGAPQMSGTPVVPISPFVTMEARRRVAQDLAERLERKGQALVDEAEVATTEVSAAAASKPKRSTTDITARTSAKKSTAAAPPRPTPLTREQVIRVGAQRLMQRLNELNLVIHQVRNDGNCQFRALSQQLFGSEEYHDIVRSHVASYMKSVRAESFDFYFESKQMADAYFAALDKDGTWGDELTLRGASDSLFINIHVLSSQKSNSYITYRPGPNAPAAPAFLIDIRKMRALRRAEREQRRRWQQPSSATEGGRSLGQSSARATANPSPARTPTAQATSAAAAAPVGRAATPPVAAAAAAAIKNVQDSEEEELDANAMQRALQEHLSRAEIRGSTPYYTADGTLHHPSQRPRSAAVMASSEAATTTATTTSPALGFSLPPPRSTSSIMGVSFNHRTANPADGVLASSAASFVDGPMPDVLMGGSAPMTPPLGTAAPGAGAAVEPAAEMRKFVAAGAELGAPLASSVTVFTHEATEKNLAGVQRPPARLHHGVMTSNRNSSPVFCVTAESDVALMACSPLSRSAGGGGAASFTGRSPFPLSHSCGAIDSRTFLDDAVRHAEEAEADPYFLFAAHEEPIDVFLSYLYPVHYSALSVVDPTAAAPEEPSSAQYLSVPFLRRSEGSLGELYTGQTSIGT